MNTQKHRWLRLSTMSAWVRISLLTSSATLFAFGANWWWPFELLTHFRVQYIWLLTPLAVGLLVGKRYSVAILTGGCLIWNLALVVPDYFRSTAVVDSPVQLRLMSANVHTSNRDYDLFLQNVRVANPDVLLVMEIDDRWSQALADLRSKYPHGESIPRADNFGIALFSKLPIEALSVKRVGSAGVPSIQARVKVGGGTVCVFGMHTLPPLGRNSALRNEQLSATAELVARIEGPLIVAGDLNITPWSPFFREFLNRSGLHDSRRGFGVQATWPSHLGLAGIPIDHVLVSDEVSVIDRRVGIDFGSDHRPVIADLALTLAQVPQKRTKTDF